MDCGPGVAAALVCRVGDGHAFAVGRAAGFTSAVQVPESVYFRGRSAPDVDGRPARQDPGRTAPGERRAAKAVPRPPPNRTAEAEKIGPSLRRSPKLSLRY